MRILLNALLLLHVKGLASAVRYVAHSTSAAVHRAEAVSREWQAEAAQYEQMKRGQQ